MEPATPAASAVALVASAGGLAAVTAVLEGLPASFPAAVLVLVHQEPDRTSQLTGILEPRCALPVAVATEGAPLAGGQVLVAPGGMHLVVLADRSAGLFASGPYPPNRPSADLLLTTLAVAYAERAVAVVLSGHGQDGATGATAVHSRGGTVVASSQGTSEVPEMPDATISRPATVDLVLPLDEIPAALERLAAVAPG